MITPEYKYEIIQRNDIVDVIQSYVQLQQNGRMRKGLCPFHNEKTPSFVVYPETQSYYCFGCGAAGNVINFTMQYKSLEFVEAIKDLAQRCGMPAPDEDDVAGKQRARILSINKETAKFFFKTLNSEQGKQARAYWRNRGLSDSTIVRFGLGYAPDSFDSLRNHLRNLRYSDDEMLQAGVVRKSEKGHVYDLFRNRVMTPIFDIRGNVVAFGGRVLDDQKPKYVNSPETMVYKKSKTLFALNVAKKNTGKKFVLCEGYMDAIAMHQAGITTAVAGCGTALTEEQVRILSDYAQELVLCYDSDEAGQKATARAIEHLKNSPIRVSILKIPNAKDPDEYIKKFGAEQFNKLLDGSSNEIEFKLQQVKDKFDLSQPSERVEYIKEALKVLTGRITATERDVYAGRIAQETDVTKNAVLLQLDSAIKTKMRMDKRNRERAILQEGTASKINVPYQQGGAKAIGVAYAEQQLVVAMIKNPQNIQKIANNVQPSQFISVDMAEVFNFLLQNGHNKQALEPAVIMSEMQESTRQRLSQILASNYDISISEQDVQLYLDRVQNALNKPENVAQKSIEELNAILEEKRRSRQDLQTNE